MKVCSGCGVELDNSWCFGQPIVCNDKEEKVVDAGEWLRIIRQQNK